MSRTLQGKKLRVGDRVLVPKVGAGRVIEVHGQFTKIEVPGKGTEELSPTELLQWRVKKMHR